jgi:hypothetical protein
LYYRCCKADEDEYVGQDDDDDDDDDSLRVTNTRLSMNLGQYITLCLLTNVIARHEECFLP